MRHPSAFCLLPPAFCLFLLVLNSAAFLFHQPYYESWDLAANSLSIERARHFAEWYGAYSRWGFHHPGPASFYALAFGEWLFYDQLHLTPAPFNAQVLAQLCISTAFFGAALGVFARRLPRRALTWFWPLAIAAGAVHFGLASRLPSYDFLRGPSAFASTWPAHEIVMPFLCLLAAGASVAAGRGEDLPLLAVSAGTLLHLHVAQPLFVGPMVLLACVGLIRNGGVRPLRSWHALAAGLIVTMFALPLAGDLFRGAESNLAAILHHLRTHHGEHKSLVKSVLYLLQFGAYTPYQTGRLDFGHFDGAGALAYLGAHAAVLGFWLGALLSVAGIVARGKFLKWEGWFLFLGIVLTLYWGTIQDGEMFYYNAWLNFALYYFGLLIVIAEISARLDALPLAWPVRLVPVAAALVTCALMAERWRVRDPIPETTALLHESLERLLAADIPPTRADRPRVIPEFVFSEQAWPVAAAVGLAMARAHRDFEVSDRWVNEFGGEHAEPRSFQAAPVVPWRFKTGPDALSLRSDGPEALAPLARSLRAQLAARPAAGPDFPLPDETTLSTASPVVDLTDGRVTEIDFRTGGNAPDFAFGGWSAPEPWGTWTDGAYATLDFTPGQTTPGDVEITADLHAFVFPASGLTSQRVSLLCNGYHLAPPRRVAADLVTLTWIIPASTWNKELGRGFGISLLFLLPDAASPATLDHTGQTTDTRHLGIGVSTLRLRPAPAATP